MSLQPDSLVTDLIFQGNAALDQAMLVEGLGGEELLATKQVLDIDRLDPRAEMELSPSMPFRRRGEKRIMLLDANVVPPRADPQADPIVRGDLRPAREELIGICERLPIRLGRLFVLGNWGDAVIVARNIRDLRAIALVLWALDPQTDVYGKRRGSQLSNKEFEEKLLAYEKRLDELDDEQIFAGLAGIAFERRGDLMIVDVLEADGTWDQRKSMVLEQQLAAVERFSLMPGAPSTTAPRVPLPVAGPAGVPAAPPLSSLFASPPAAAGAAPAVTAGAAARAAAPTKPAPIARAPAPTPAPVPAPVPEPKVEPKGPPLGAQEIDGKVVLVFPPERFDRDVAAALGKRDWDHVIRSSDKLTGEQRDKLHRDGALWVAPIEFLSEVFVEGKPLTKQAFERDAQTTDGVKSLEVHFPRFGEVQLFEIAGKGRFVTSLPSASSAARLVA